MRGGSRTRGVWGPAGSRGTLRRTVCLDPSSSGWLLPLLVGWLSCGPSPWKRVQNSVELWPTGCNKQSRWQQTHPQRSKVTAAHCRTDGRGPVQMKQPYWPLMEAPMRTTWTKTVLLRTRGDLSGEPEGLCGILASGSPPLVWGRFLHQ